MVIALADGAMLVASCFRLPERLSGLASLLAVRQFLILLPLGSGVLLLPTLGLLLA